MLPRYEQPAGGSWSERRRRIRFRRQRERLRFSEEIKLVPRGLVIGTLALFAALIGVAVWMCYHDIPAPWHVADDMGTKAGATLVGLIGTATAIALAAIIFLSAYVYRDARRRGMNAGLWLFLVLIMLPAYIALGYVLYFAAREPLPFHCPKCGSMVNARFNYCPTCQFALQPTCGSCRREIGDLDRYCPYCGHDVDSKALEQV